MSRGGGGGGAPPPPPPGPPPPPPGRAPGKKGQGLIFFPFGRYNGYWIGLELLESYYCYRSSSIHLHAICLHTYIRTYPLGYRARPHIRGRHVFRNGLKGCTHTHTRVRLDLVAWRRQTLYGSLGYKKGCLDAQATRCDSFGRGRPVV